MRWFSWFQCEKWYSGECWANKFIMLWGSDKCSPTGVSPFGTADEVEALSMPTSGLTDRQELQRLKLKHGTWALAPLLVTPTTMFQKDLIKFIVQPCWTHHASRAEKILTPQESALHTIQKCLGGWVDELYDLVLQGFLSTEVLRFLYPQHDTSERTKSSRLNMHFGFVTKLMAKRSMSLMAQYLRPPIRYSCLLSFQDSEAQGAQFEMQADWEKLLSLEEKYATGDLVPGLEALHFLQSSVTRLAYILNERDLLDSTSNAQAVMKALILHLGDSSCVENTHQSAKDCLREARHNQRSRVLKMKACLDSKILQSRNAPHVSVNELELAMSSSKQWPPFVPLTNPNSHKLNKDFQLLMQHKSGSHYWPSTSAATQFEEAMAFEFLMGTRLDAQHQFSFLAGEPGSVLLNQSQQALVMVLAKTTSGFTGWHLEVFSWESEQGQVSDDLFFRVIDKKSAFVIQHITSLDGWFSVPCQPCLEKSCGALVLMQTGEPLPLVKARVQSGLDLTVKETKAVLFAHNVKLPGAPSKEDCYKALIELYTENGQDFQDCLSKANVKASQEDEEDRASEYEELLNLIEEDLENHNDPDVKQEKSKIKRRKLQKPKVPEGHITLEPPKKGRGKGRGRGKGGKGRGRGRGKKNTSQENQQTASKPELQLPDIPSQEEIGVTNAISSQIGQKQLDELVAVFGHEVAQELCSQVAAESLGTTTAPPTAGDFQTFLEDKPAIENHADGLSPQPSSPSLTSSSSNGSSSFDLGDLLESPKASDKAEPAAGSASPAAPPASVPVGPQPLSQDPANNPLVDAPPAQEPDVEPENVLGEPQPVPTKSQLVDAAPAAEPDVAGDLGSCSASEVVDAKPAVASEPGSTADVPPEALPREPSLPDADPPFEPENVLGEPQPVPTKSPVVDSAPAAEPDVAGGLGSLPAWDSLAGAQPEVFVESAPADSLADTQPAELVESQPGHVGSMVTLDEPGLDTLADTQPEAPADSQLGPDTLADTQAEAPAGSGSLPASGSRKRGPNVYSSPSSLHTIAPPGCSILLNRHWVAFGSH